MVFPVGVIKSLAAKAEEKNPNIIDDKTRSEVVKDLDKDLFLTKLKKFDPTITIPGFEITNQRFKNLLTNKNETELDFYMEYILGFKHYKNGAPHSKARLEKLFPAYRKYLLDSSNKTLSLGKSGEVKYPKQHSIYSATTQESRTSSSSKKNKTLPMGIGQISGARNRFPPPKPNKAPQITFDKAPLGMSNYARELIKNMEGANTFLEALNKTQETYKGISLIPSAPVTRKGEGSTDFEKFALLFIQGSPNPGETPSMLTYNGLKESTEKHFSEDCKGFDICNNPDIQELDEKFGEMAAYAREKNIPLVLYYYGHGTTGDVQKGVSKIDITKQGALEFFFQLSRVGKNGISEEQIKKLYEKHFSDIEVVTVFDACYSGAAVASKNSEQSFANVA